MRCDDGIGEMSEHGNVSGDGSGPISRSSVTHVAYVVGKFDDVKKDLVRQIGFGGILELPQITKVDRKFTLWLLTKLDTAKRCIIVNDECVTSVIDFEVARILGIPCGRRQVCSLDQIDKRKKIDFIQNFIGSKETECNSLMAAEVNVKAQYDPPLQMTKKDMDSFKVSFVVWVMGHLLAPTKKHNDGSDGFWGALLAPDEIKQFNWAGYVIDELINAARDVQTAISNNKNVATITGCPILLQVLYFESINMGSLNRPRGISPRVKVYDGKSLSLMIAADKASSSTDPGNGIWGSSIRRLPEIGNEYMHLSTERRKDETDIVSKNCLINDLGKYLRCRYGEKLSTSQSIAFNWFQARCTHHFKQLRLSIEQDCKQFRLSIQQDCIQLAAKLFGSDIPATPPTVNHFHVEASRPAQSEPARGPTYTRSALKKKRAYQSSGSWSNARSSKKHNVSFSQKGLPETLLSGMSVTSEDEVGHLQSESGHESTTHSHNSEQMDVPSFDLGIDFNEVEMDTGNNVFLGSPAQSQSSDHSGNHSLSYSNTDASATDKTVMPSLFSTQDSSDTLESLNDNKDGECPTPAWFNALCGTPSGVKTVQPADKDGECPTPAWFNALCGTPPVVKTVQPAGFTTPDERKKNFTTSPRSLSKILAEADLVDRMTFLDDNPNINIKPWDDDYSDSPIQKRSIGIPMFPECPWTYNLSHRCPPSDIVDKFFDDVSTCNYGALNRPWLSHTCPRHIEMDGLWIQKSFIAVSGLSYDVCDLAIRRIRQLDAIMYSESPSLHWRHILESEFAMFALAGEIPYNRKAIIQQFIGSSLCYKLEDCHMIVVPAYVLLNWCCYFFDFKEKCVHVIDPLYNEDQSDVFKQMHCPNVSKVAAALDKCLDFFFENWHSNLESWDIRFVQPTIVDATSAETGLLTLMYICHFDGRKIHLVDRASFIHFKKVMLYELMSLSDNRIKAPLPLTISIDD